MTDELRVRFTTAYENHYAAVSRYAERRAGADVAPDVVAETFTTAWRKVAEMPDEPLPWLLGVARRVLSNQLRAATRRRRLSEKETLQRPTAGRDPADSVAESNRVREALARLPAGDRELLTLIGWDGLTTQEAAVVLDIKPGTAAVRLHRARRRLEEQLQLHEGPGLSARPKGSGQARESCHVSR